MDATQFRRLIVARCDEALSLLTSTDQYRLDATVAAPPYGSNRPVNGYLFTGF